MLGELDIPFKAVPQIDVSLLIDNYIQDFLNNKTAAHAGDLISAAIVNGFEKNETVIDAAKFILANADYSSKPLISASERIVFGYSDIDKNNHLDLDSITFNQCDDYVDLKLIWRKIHLSKQIAIDFPYNPIIWVELSRLYSTIGQRKQAINAMKIALQYAPDNRFVLRSAVRLFAHYDELELSHDLVRKNNLTNFDPWLTSAEISLATLRSRNSRFIKRGIELISSNNYHPFSFTELASSIGTVEIINGNNKRSREFFRKSLLAPNDNSLAQIEWASKIDNQLDIHPADYKIKNNYEALALENFNNNRLNEALNNTFHWFLDMPFTKRPVLLGSHIGELLDDKEKTRDFLKAGLISHPNDPQLLNNLSYSYALENMTKEALESLDKISHDSSIEITTKICLTATRGLVYFRSGFPDLGRKLYLEAIQDAKDINNEYYNWLAILNYVREEILIKSESVNSLMDIVSLIPDKTEYIYIQKLKKEVVDLFYKSRK